MSYPINYPTPQGANVQIFRGGDSDATHHTASKDWVKPQGASFVFFMLIGSGGGGGGGMYDSGGPFYYPGGGGGSGNVTNFMCPAFLLPDALQVDVGSGGNGGAATIDAPAEDGISGTSTQIIYQRKDSQGYQILLASAGAGGRGANGGNGGGGNGQAADTGGPMTVAGFYNATGGQTGAVAGAITTNDITFVMGGNGSDEPATLVTGYYGYKAAARSGYSQLSPIPLAIPRLSTQLYLLPDRRAEPQSFGCGGSGGGSTTGISSGGKGGDGLVVIVTW